MRSTLAFVLAVSSVQFACNSHNVAPRAPDANSGPTPASTSQSAAGSASDASLGTASAAAQVGRQPSSLADTTVSSSSKDQTASGSPAPITAKLEARSGSNATGTVTVTPSPEGVRVQVRVSRVSPGAHGLHFHETGDCSAEDAASAKGHYNPTQKPHALPGASARHLGDMGNITVDKNGEGSLDIVLNGATLVPNAPNTLLGTAVILHEKKDDGSQPSGNAGARIGCAVISR